MMTVEQYQVYQITNAFAGRIWKNLCVVDRYLLGDWRADEKLNYRVGDEITLYNELFRLKVKAVRDREYGYPSKYGVIEKVTKNQQSEA